jgi:hypothetical protein
VEEILSSVDLGATITHVTFKDQKVVIKRQSISNAMDVIEDSTHQEDERPIRVSLDSH